MYLPNFTGRDLFGQELEHGTSGRDNGIGLKSVVDARCAAGVTRLADGRRGGGLCISRHLSGVWAKLQETIGPRLKKSSSLIPATGLGRNGRGRHVRN